MAPLVSIFIPARNDNFMDTFRYRIETTLNYLAQSLGSIGRLAETEVMVVDWGSELPLHQTLTISDTARQIVKYLIVPPDIARETQGTAAFPIVLAQNAALRRCRGTYLMQTDSDVLFTPEFCSTLFEMLERGSTSMGPVGQLFFGAKRCQIPWEVINAQPQTAALDAYVREHRTTLPLDYDCGFGYCTTGMMMMHRRLWEECSGYDERLIHWGWMEVDLGLRVTRRYSWYDVTMHE